MTAIVRYPSLAVRDAVIASGMARGAGIGYDRLEDLVEELPAVVSPCCAVDGAR